MRDTVLYGLAGVVILGVGAVVWFSARYQAYLAQLRSGSGKRPAKVWKPFWFD